MRIRYFAWLKLRVGTAAEEVDPPAEVTTVAALQSWLAVRHPRFGEALEARGVVRCAVNHVHVGPEAPVSLTDEVAFFPPVTGG